jgi:hypothetical protein
MPHAPAMPRVSHPGQHRKQARRVSGSLVHQVNEVAYGLVNKRR